MGRSRQLRLGEGGPTRQLTKPPLGDASNRGVPAASKESNGAPKAQSARPAEAGPAAPASCRRRGSPPPLPAAADALLLPGLDDDGPPATPSCQLPLHDNSDEASSYGNPLATGDSLRVTSIARSASARRYGQLRLVVQADTAEGRRLSSMPPQQRPAARPRTVPLQQKRSKEQAGSPASTDSLSAAAADSSTDSLPAAAADSSTAQPAEPASATTQPAEEACGSAASLPPPLPVEPGAEASPAKAADSSSGGQAQSDGAEEEAEQQQGQQGTGAQQDAAEQPGETAAVHDHQAGAAEANAAAAEAQASREANASAVYTGVPADVEAAAMPGTPPPPAWLHQQGACRNEPGTRLEAAPFMAMHNHHAAAMWRSMWLHGLQWHNACRVGHPIKAGSPWAFIPLDPNEPLLEMFMFHTSVMPEHVIAGAARFEDILLGDQQLHTAALEAGVFSFGMWGVPTDAGGISLVEGGRAMALPVSLRCAPPQTVALFVACVWHEANRAETAAHATYTLSASGERVADERFLKHAISDLAQWVQLAVGGNKRFAEELLAALAHLSCFGTE